MKVLKKIFKVFLCIYGVLSLYCTIYMFFLMREIMLEDKL